MSSYKCNKQQKRKYRFEMGSEIAKSILLKDVQTFLGTLAIVKLEDETSLLEKGSQLTRTYLPAS